MTRPARLPALIAAVAAVVVALDQLTKSLVVARLQDHAVHVVWTLRLTLSYNSGAAFSQGTGFTPFITIAVVALVAGMLFVARKVTTTPLAVALGLVLGGACGNLADRLLRGNGGAVIDFIDFQWWPVFNVADIAVCCGAVLLVLSTFRTAEAT